VTEADRQLARLVFDFHQLRHQPRPSDVIIGLGTNDIRVAHHAVDLYEQRLAPRILFTGGVAHVNDLLATPWTDAEADVFAQVALDRGVPASAIIRETKATNTSENIRFARQLLKGEKLTSVILAVKPFMQRRAFATYAVVWPEMPVTVSTWATTFDDYCHAELPPDKVLNIILGDLQRIWIYGARGFSAPQIIPPDVVEAFQTLVARGYDSHLVKGGPLSP